MFSLVSLVPEFMLAVVLEFVLEDGLLNVVRDASMQSAQCSSQYVIHSQCQAALVLRSIVVRRREPSGKALRYRTERYWNMQGRKQRHAHVHVDAARMVLCVPHECACVCVCVHG